MEIAGIQVRYDTRVTDFPSGDFMIQTFCSIYESGDLICQGVVTDVTMHPLFARMLDRWLAGQDPRDIAARIIAVQRQAAYDQAVAKAR